MPACAPCSSSSSPRAWRAGATPTRSASATALLLSRIAHAWGVSRTAGTSLGRLGGMAVTWGVMVAMAAVAIAGYAMQQLAPPAY